MSKNVALLIATYQYKDPELQQLEAAAHDAESLAAVLRDSNIAGFDVTILINQPHYLVGESLGDFLQGRRRDDLTLIYITGHGIKDDDGKLYFAMTNTRRDSLLFTALSGEQVSRAMESCRSRRQILVLDCCYSGAFPAGYTVKADTAVNTFERFKGHGRTILTASDSTQFSFVGNNLKGRAAQSIFTRHLVAGIHTGEADLDGDGDITVDELYEYVYERVTEEMPSQRPMKRVDIEGRLVIAKNINWSLPSYLKNLINSQLAIDRLNAIEHLEHLYKIGNLHVRAAVNEEIHRLGEDDSRTVSEAAKSLLQTIMPQPPESPSSDLTRAEERAQREAEERAQREAEERAQREAEEPRLLGGRYDLDGVVGRGGMADVYRAHDVLLDRIVAIKILRTDLARDQLFQARFVREAQSAASLNHPSIVAVYDTGEDMATGVPVPYIVMEYVDGRTVRDLLQEGRRLLPERSLEIIDGVLRALDYSHQAGIVHRDIKPGNVMMTRNGDIKAMDFGIARAMSDADDTEVGQVIGTSQYLSPEQARGERMDSRSDLYSTGCLLYELLTGRPPFTGDSPVAIAYQHVRENPIPPSRVDPDVPAWADAIVLKAMAKSPADRYQTAADMRADLQRAAAGTSPFQSGVGSSRLLGGRYQLSGIIGRGGMSEVYLAHDILLNRLVAVKMLRKDLATHKTLRERFLHQARSAARLRHPSIVTVYDANEEATGSILLPYIVTEYVDGLSLHSLLGESRQLHPEDALKIIDGVLQALDHSHYNDVVHRNIRPGNVMITRNAEVKVMDFGPRMPGDDTTSTGVIGTANYLSPEQARGESVDWRSDLYSTGCLLYELLTGRPPFTGDSPIAIAYQHVIENPVPPSKVNPEIPGLVDSVVLRAMAKDPARRYQSAVDMRTDIERALTSISLDRHNLRGHH
jgi:serine/threonine protein kinase